MYVNICQHLSLLVSIFYSFVVTVAQSQDWVAARPLPRSAPGCGIVGAQPLRHNAPNTTPLPAQRPGTRLCWRAGQLDPAACDGYGWPHELTDEQVLERLLALNLERARV
jgi:hypothetical protein